MNTESWTISESKRSNYGGKSGKRGEKIYFAYKTRRYGALQTSVIAQESTHGWNFHGTATLLRHVLIGEAERADNPPTIFTGGQSMYLQTPYVKIIGPSHPPPSTNTGSFDPNQYSYIHDNNLTPVQTTRRSCL